MNLIPLFLAAALFAAQDQPTSDKSSSLPALPSVAPMPAPSSTSNIKEGRSSLIIDPKARAQDYSQAFELLRREKPTLKINIQTSNGTLSNVAELSSAENGTLMLVKIPFSQGTKYLIVPIEDVKEIAYSP